MAFALDEMTQVFKSFLPIGRERGPNPPPKSLKSGNAVGVKSPTAVPGSLMANPLAELEPGVQAHRWHTRVTFALDEMTQVFKSLFPVCGQDVALKLVRSELADDLAFRARFRREVEAGHRVGGICTAK